MNTMHRISGSNLWSNCCQCVHKFSSCSDGPLKGIKVLDMTRVLAGPTGTMVLADYGADVYKIEDTNGGDVTRSWPPFLANSQISCYYASLNRGKKSVCVNLKTDEGQQLLRNMASKCDILVENFVPGVLCKYGLDYDNVNLVAPHLIYCSITGFGAEGPYARKPAVDLIAASVGGHISMTGTEDGDPCRSSVSAIDIMTGLYTMTATLAALYRRQRTGRGCKIDGNLFSTALVTMEQYPMACMNLGVVPKRLGTEHESVVPYKSFKSKDGYFTIAAIGEAQFKEMCEILGRPELSEDKKFSSNSRRVQFRKKLNSILGDIFATKSTKEWCEIFMNSSLPHGALNNIGQAMEDPHTKAINIVKEVEFGMGKVKTLGPAIKFNDYEVEMKRPPFLGEHTDEVLRTLLNYTETEIQKLRGKKVIR